jgi:gas vesicle protein
MRIGNYESSSENSNIGTAITFLLIGLGAGALAGLLLAPKTGKQMRRDLKRGYDDSVDTVGDWADEAKDHVRNAGDRVREASERVRDVASRGAEMAEDFRNAARDKVEPLRKAITRS